MSADLHIDYETRSAVDLRKTGVHVYAEDVTTEVWCAAYAFDGDPKLWVPGDPCPYEILEHAVTGGTFVAHNAAFEIAIARGVLTARHGWPEIPVAQWRCTMAQSYAMAMPGALEDAAAAFGLEQRKDMDGRRLILAMAKPRKVIGQLPATSKIDAEPDADGWQRFIGADGLVLKIQWWVDDARRQKGMAYCQQDVRTERALDERTLRLRPAEQALWVLDQKINNRGVVVDEEVCHAANAIVDRARKRNQKEIRDLTDYRVTTTTNVNQIRAWLTEQGVFLENLAADQVKEALARDDISPVTRRVLELRQMGARMSVAKVNSLLAGTSLDGRARGLLQYHAASTGRWGGRRFQPQNLKRPDKSMKPLTDTAIELLRARDYETFESVFDDPIEAISNLIRGFVCAPEGQQMGAADFANIEGRVLAWLAGEAWKLDAFRAYDAGTGPDLYKLAFHKSFGVPLDRIEDEDRQVGKVQELALGYQGGPGAFQAMARGYGVDIGARYDEISALAGPLLDESEDAFAAYGRKSGMHKRNWVAAEIVKRGWRAGHPRTVSFWSNLEDAALDAVRQPGAVATCGRLRLRVRGSFLWMVLPSGRALCYPYPKIQNKRTPWGSTKEMVTFFGQDTYTRKWGRTSTYGGKLVENATQAVARDLLAESIVRLEEQGVEVVLHVHDENVFYLPLTVDNCEHICATMSDSAAWAEGLPVAAEGWVGQRYRK